MLIVLHIQPACVKLHAITAGIYCAVTYGQCSGGSSYAGPTGCCSSQDSCFARTTVFAQCRPSCPAPDEVHDGFEWLCRFSNTGLPSQIIWRGFIAHGACRTEGGSLGDWVNMYDVRSDMGCRAACAEAAWCQGYEWYTGSVAALASGSLCELHRVMPTHTFAATPLTALKF